MPATKTEVKFEDLPQETRALIAPVLSAIDAFKSENNAALAKKADRDDPLVKEKLDKATADIDGLKDMVNKAVAEINRAGKARGDDRDAELKTKAAKLAQADRCAFDAFIRAPNNTQAERAMAAHYDYIARADEFKSIAEAWGIEQKDLSTVVAAEGGYLVRPEYEAQMEEILLESSPIRQLADVREIGAPELKLPINRKGANTSWINEKGSRSETNAPTFSVESFFAQELYAYPEVTLSMLEDALFDVEAFLGDEVAEAFRIEEALQCVTGDGNGKPRGFLATGITKVAMASYDANTNWGSIAYKGTGASGAFAAAPNGADVLIDVVYDMKPAFRQNADWAMSRHTLGAVRKLKDSNGDYLVRDAITNSGLMPMLLGYPTWEFEDMPEIAADSYSIAFADFKRAYLIVDRVGMQVRRDEITKPGFVKYHFRKRTGGDVKNYDAIKLVKFG